MIIKRADYKRFLVLALMGIAIIIGYSCDLDSDKGYKGPWEDPGHDPNFVISLSASPNVIPADGSSTTTLTATLTDPNGVPIPQQSIYFSATDGELSSDTATTNAAGKAIVQLTSSYIPGNKLCRAMFGSRYASTYVTFEGSGLDIELQVDPTWTIADSYRTVELVAYVTNGEGSPIPNIPVVFTTDHGCIIGGIGEEQQFITNNNGRATAILQTGYLPTGHLSFPATVSAQVTLENNKTYKAYNEIVVWNWGVDFWFKDETIDATSATQVIAKAQSWTIPILPIQNVAVSFAVSGGGTVIPSTVYTNEEGEAIARFEGDGTTGTAGVTCSISLTDCTGFSKSWSQTKYITLGGTTGFMVNISVNPETLPADGASQSVIIVRVTDTEGVPIDDMLVEYELDGQGELSADADDYCHPYPEIPNVGYTWDCTEYGYSTCTLISPSLSKGGQAVVWITVNREYRTYIIITYTTPTEG